MCFLASTTLSLPLPSIKSSNFRYRFKIELRAATDGKRKTNAIPIAQNVSGFSSNWTNIQPPHAFACVSVCAIYKSVWNKFIWVIELYLCLLKRKSLWKRFSFGELYVVHTKQDHRCVKITKTSASIITHGSYSALVLKKSKLLLAR